MTNKGCPFGEGPGEDMPSGGYGTQEPRSITDSDLTYNGYLKVAELLNLQELKSLDPATDKAHHDELLFIIIHQTYELWFKLMLHEIEQTIDKMREAEVLTAHHFLKRVVEIMKLMVSQIHILETMAPYDFLQFRDLLNPASGFQSLQFREIEFVAGLKDARYIQYFNARPEVVEALRKRLAQPDLRTTFYDMLRGLGFPLPDNAAELETRGDATARQAIIDALLPIYQKPEEHLALGLLTESLVELDEYLQLWREHHVRVVERIIGMKQGTGGSSGVEYLKSTTTKKCFPLLWEVRTHLMKKKP